MTQSNIIMYTTEDGVTKIEVTFDHDTVWLSIDQMAELFQRDKSIIGKHVRNIFKEGELIKEAVWAKFAYTASDGKTYQVDFYNLDVIISVGYRVKSLRGTQFRIWATSILKEYMKKGFALDDERLKNLGGAMAHAHKIRSVQPGSIAWEMGIEPGDRLLSVDGQEIEDVFDYRYYIEEEEILLLIEKPDGEQWELEIEKETYEDLGLEFEQGLMDEYRSCRNKCIFCFIDQMPPGMRDTLYFKDDDSRLSFLQGNYVTLTNMSEHDIRRIIRFHLEPINISFQTMNPELRCRMLHNRFAGEALKKVDMLYEAGIEMNGQIVLCKGFNDGEELDRSIRELTRYLPFLRSVSVVPVGLTRFREGLEPLEPFTGEEARQVLELIHGWQERLYPEHGLHFIHASDEWYILAGEELPEEESYDGYLQLENGVGMLRLLLNEFAEALEEEAGDREERRLSLATGLLAAPYLERMAEQLREKFPRTEVMVCPVKNEFFGEQITVSGLITGQDLVKQLSGKDLAERLLLPCNMLRAEEDVFLDDFTVSQVQSALQVPLNIVKSSGQDLLDAILGRDPDAERFQTETNQG